MSVALGPVAALELVKIPGSPPRGGTNSSSDPIMLFGRDEIDCDGLTHESDRESSSWTGVGSFQQKSLAKAEELL